MKQKSFLLLLFIGLLHGAVTWLRSVHHSYHLILKSLPWPDAQNYCRTVYTDMATIITDDDWTKLNKEAVRVGFTGYAWIGLYNDVNSWRWSFHETPLKNVPYSNWYSGEPNNYAGKEACVIVYVYGTWSDTQCIYLKPFICYNATFTGDARFIGINTPMSWTQAQTYCRTYHTDLASSLNSSDTTLLTQLRNSQGDSWIGLYRDTWKWSDGTNATNLPWASGEPNNYWGNENCASHINKVYNDYLCSQPAYFYCHTIRPAREQQMIKVQVKTDGNGFDPAFQSTLLEKMKMKLEEKGMLENTTLTWKVRPDGNVFYKKIKDDL